VLTSRLCHSKILARMQRGGSGRMGWLQFIDSMVGRLAWPIVVLVLAFALRRQLVSLAERLLKLSVAGATVEFDKILQKGAEIIEQAPIPELPKPAEQPNLNAPNVTVPTEEQRKEVVARLKKFRGRRRSTSTGSSLAQIFSGLEEIDKLLFEVGDTLGVDAASPLSVMYALVDQKRIPKNIAKLYEALRDARSLIAHTQAMPDENEAIEYVRQASYLTVYLDLLNDAIKNEQGKAGAAN
jgi:hypothetical protein